MELNNLLKTKKVKLTTGETVTIRELSYGSQMEIHQLAMSESSSVGSMTVQRGVLELADTDLHEIEANMPLWLVQEIVEYVNSISGFDEDVEGNSESEQTEDSPIT